MAMEAGDIVYYKDWDENLIVLGEESKTTKKGVYRCLTYNFDVTYIDEEDLKKVGTSYALFKVAYDLRS